MVVAGAAVEAGAFVPGTTVVTGATVVVLGAAVEEVGAAVEEVGTAGTRQVCQKCKLLICTQCHHRTTLAWSQKPHLKSLFREDVFCLRWHPAHWSGWWW